MGKGSAAVDAAAEEPREKAPVNPGDLISSKFRVERVIGEGGMGFVVEATHLQLEERVALKFLRKSAMAMPDVVSRFAQEARAAVRLKSEHVARIIDVGSREDGMPFMVMEYLEGADLGQVVDRDGPLKISDAVEYVIQACEGVGEAHARGIVHRDIKPENLFLVTRDDGWKLIKVLDFGISKAALTSNSPELIGHETKSLMGSPFYMSPEQLRSTRTVDHRADIWSMGVVLFELLTGTVAFDPERSFTELVADILETPHRRLRLFRPDAPPELEQIVDRCLQKDRTLRFQNCAELAIALLPFAPRRSRVTAERTTSFTRAAGLLSDPHLQVPASIAPPGLGNPSDHPSSAVRPSARARATSPTEPQLPSLSPRPVVATTPPAPTRSSIVAVFGALLVLAMLVVVGLLFRNRTTQTTQTTQATNPPSAVTSSVPAPSVQTAPITPTTQVTPATAALAPTVAPSTTAESTDGALASAKPHANHPVPVPATAHGAHPVHSAGTPSASVSASAGPRTDALEIRRER
ncbi:MAG: serine/threonine protein kinase [Myxococcaceae bacterium]|nr:serine/threonine protein kinase [Myxococcaceae bacterium]